MRIKEERLVTTPAKAVCATRWIEVLFGSSTTGPMVRATSRIRRYVRSTSGSDFAKCKAMLIGAFYSRYRAGLSTELQRRLMSYAIVQSIRDGALDHVVHVLR